MEIEDNELGMCEKMTRKVFLLNNEVSFSVVDKQLKFLILKYLSGREFWSGH